MTVTTVWSCSAPLGLNLNMDVFRFGSSGSVTRAHLPPHYVSMCIAGESLFSVSGTGGEQRRHHCVPGSLFVAGSNFEYAEWLGCVDILHVFPASVGCGPIGLKPLSARSGIREASLEGLLFLLYREARSNWGSGRIYADALFGALLSYLQANFKEIEASQSAQTQLTRAQLVKVLAFIKANLSNDISVKDLAALVHLSVSRFTLLFANSLGVTTYQYILHERVKCGAALLSETRTSLAEIAHIVGFSDQSHFTKIFKRTMHTTPGAFRKAGAG